MKKLILSLLAVTMMTPIARASEGGHGGSGGDGYMCPKAHPEQGSYPPYNLSLVDTYGHGDVDDLISSNEGQLLDPFGIRTVSRFLDRKMPNRVYPHPYLAGVKISFGQLVLMKYFQLYFYHSELAQLPDISDDNISWWSIPRGCKKVQLAIQDIKTGVVRMSEVTPNLGLIDDVFLRLHEILISLRAQPGLDTTPVRRDVDRLAAIVLNNRADFVRGLTQDYEKAMTIPDGTPDLKVAKNLRCNLTWKMDRLDKFQPKFNLPSTVMLTRTQGSGVSTDKNVYQLTVGQKAFTSTSTNMILQPTIYNSTTASQINAFETKFEVSPGITYQAAVYDFVPELGVYTADISASYTDTATSSKSKQMSSHEAYNTAGMICVPVN